jgi:hypothetical protein
MYLPTLYFSHFNYFSHLFFHLFFFHSTTIFTPLRRAARNAEMAEFDGFDDDYLPSIEELQPEITKGERPCSSYAFY